MQPSKSWALGKGDLFCFYSTFTVVIFTLPLMDASLFLFYACVVWVTGEQVPQVNVESILNLLPQGNQIDNTYSIGVPNSNSGNQQREKKSVGLDLY